MIDLDDLRSDFREYGIRETLQVRWTLLDPAAKQALIGLGLSLALLALEYLRPKQPLPVRIVG